MNIAHWLSRTATHMPDAPAILHGDDLIFDYAGFHAASAGIASSLRNAGIRPGDRIALFMKNHPAYLVTLYGIWIAGAAAVPINAKLHAREAAYILADSGARLVFATADSARELSPETGTEIVDVDTPAFQIMCRNAPLAVTARDTGDLAWLFYTSGTTGRPKGVTITHSMLQAVSAGYPLDVDIVEMRDGAFYAAPMSHGAGLYAMIHVRMGARHICPASGGFDAPEILAIAARAGPLSMFMAPTMVRRFTDAAKAAGDRASGIKTIVYGGGPMYVADIVEAVDWFGPKFIQIYGQGECPMAITSLTRDEVADRTHANWRARLGSVGKAQSLVEVRIGDADGQPLPPGEAGEIMVRGMPVMPGYWNNEPATAATLRDGWLMTGDIGKLDAEGYLTLQDRSKDVIISGGTNIYPREVEEVLLNHPAVAEASVVGRPSAEWGEEVVAFLVITKGQTIELQELDALCQENIARFKRPKAYFMLDDLPKSNYGKVLKSELRKQLSPAG